MDSTDQVIRFSSKLRCFMQQRLGERGTDVDHSTIQRWVVRFSPQLEAEFNKKWKRPTGSSWRKDETYIKAKGDGYWWHSN